MKRNLLLISNSTLYGSGYLDYCVNEIKDFLKNKEKVLFIPYARSGGITHNEYSKIAEDCFKKMGYFLTNIDEYNYPEKALEDTDVLFIGGGNTFVLLNELYKVGILDIIRKRVKQGMLYIGTSAGSNVALIAL